MDAIEIGREGEGREGKIVCVDNSHRNCTPNKFTTTMLPAVTSKGWY